MGSPAQLRRIYLVGEGHAIKLSRNSLERFLKAGRASTNLMLVKKYVLLVQPIRPVGRRSGGQVNYLKN